MTETNWEMAHDARVRSCIVIAGIPASELRDDIRCPACDELHRLMHLDPDVLEVLTREPWCEACAAGDKPVHRHRPGYPCPVGGYVRARAFWMGPNDKHLTSQEEIALCLASRVEAARDAS